MATKKKQKKELPRPVDVLWHALVEKKIVTQEDLYKKGLELSGMTKEEFDKALGVEE